LLSLENRNEPYNKDTSKKQIKITVENYAKKKPKNLRYIVTVNGVFLATRGSFNGFSDLGYGQLFAVEGGNGAVSYLPKKRSSY